MKFKVYGNKWATDSPDPKEILEKYVSAKSQPCGPKSRTVEVDITSEELMKMSTCNEFDILISGFGEIAFDGKGKGFKGR